jgi:hypothetical protein
MTDVADRPFTGQMHDLNEKGDTKIVWSADNPDEVAIAKTAFDAARKKGMLAYKAEGRKGERGSQIREFDPDAERIILVKPLQGG